MINPHLKRMLIAAEQIPTTDLMTILALITAHTIHSSVEPKYQMKALKMYGATIKEILSQFKDNLNENQTEH